jgi:hypothetical protein
MGSESIIVSTSYFPPVGYIRELHSAKDVFIEMYETYPKQTCRNHFCIYGPNGKQTLSIPVSKPNGNHTLTRDIRIRYDLPWQQNHRRSVEAAYNNSPFFFHYRDIFSPFFSARYDFLTDLNSDILKAILGLLQICMEPQMTKSYVKSPAGLTDHRSDLASKHNEPGFPPYSQTFSERHGFISNLSILDLIFNLGPEAEAYLGA